MEQRKRDILLIAMSTLNKIEESSFRIELDEFGETNPVIEHCVGQMEPMTKYLLKNGNNNLEIVIFYTDDTVDKMQSIPQYAGGNINIQFSAVSFFVYRALKYIDAEDQWKADDFSNGNLLDGKSIEYKKGNKNLTIKLISINEDNPQEGIKKASLYIEEEKQSIEKLWIDTHGGFRDTSLAINAVVSLLKFYDIKPYKIVGARFGSEKRIVDQKKSFQMFDFVSAMNEFSCFGSASGLMHYFDSESDFNDIISAMQKISNGIRLCDPNEYVEGLDLLGDNLAELEKRLEKSELSTNATSNKIDVMSIFIKYIKEDFGVLLDKDKRTNLAIVKRCVEKQLYQQALTFIESKMVEDYANKKILYFNSTDTTTVRNIANNTGDKHTSAELFAMNKYLFLIKDYYTPYLSFNDNAQKTDWKAYKSDNNIHDNDEMWDYLATQAIEKDISNFIGKNGHYQGGQCSFASDIDVEVKRNRNDSAPARIRLWSDLKQEFYDDAARLMRLHKALKTCRNLTNHASGGIRPTVEGIGKGLVNYIELAEKLLKDDNISENVYHSGSTFMPPAWGSNNH